LLFSDELLNKPISLRLRGADQSAHLEEFNPALFEQVMNLATGTLEIRHEFVNAQERAVVGEVVRHAVTPFENAKVLLGIAQ
jgi:hypothetical protein